MEKLLSPEEDKEVRPWQTHHRSRIRASSAMEKFLTPKEDNEAAHTTCGRRSWRDKRPLRAGNWAVPCSAVEKPDIDQWDRQEIEQYMLSFGESHVGDQASLADKVRFISRQTQVDTRHPVAECSQAAQVNDAIATLACYRTENKSASCIVKHPEDCTFDIPSFGIGAVVRRVTEAQGSQSMLERLAKLDQKRGTTASRANAASSS